tara:strand:+ start:158 stop:391 length:234 start_codon:yes stop_codon:yes gene_type:complete
MGKMQELTDIIKQMIKETEERILNVRGGRGYSTAHPYPNKKDIKPSLGDPGPYSIDDDNELEINDEPVKISKAFKKE